MACADSVILSLSDIRRIQFSRDSMCGLNQERTASPSAWPMSMGASMLEALVQKGDFTDLQIFRQLIGLTQHKPEEYLIEAGPEGPEVDARRTWKGWLALPGAQRVGAVVGSWSQRSLRMLLWIFGGYLDACCHSTSVVLSFQESLAKYS